MKASVSPDTVAERLRRLIRNQLCLSRVGSSPASVDFLLPVAAQEHIHDVCNVCTWCAIQLSHVACSLIV